MPSVGFAVPLLPGKTDTDRTVMRSCCWTSARSLEPYAAIVGDAGSPNGRSANACSAPTS